MNTEEVVKHYIVALDRQEYEAAVKLIDEHVRIIGPAGESFGGPKGFISMMKKFPGRYDIKKMFLDGDEACLLYDFILKDATVYMCSWYRVSNEKINYIRTIFDPAAFENPSKTE